jgi:site-specific DNA recombinase
MERLISTRRTIHNSLTADVQEWAAIYERASDPDGGAQDKYSIPEQDRLCKQWVADEGMRVYDIYLDIGGKGDDLHRPGLERLRRDLRAGRFATVVVNEYDRFSRDSGITSIVLHEAREHDVRVVFVQEPDANDDTPMGRLLLWFKGWKAEEEHVAIRQRTQRGLRARARAGKLIPGSFPRYGYLYGDAKKTHYILDEETAHVVRRIYRDFVRGKSLQHIADDLAREGIVSPGRRAQLKGWAYVTYKGGTPRPPLPARWRVTTLRRLLKWPGYCGHHAAYCHSSGFIKKRDPLTGDVKRVHHMRLRDETDEAYIPLPDGVCPPLVSRELWEQAQARLRYNQEEAARNNHQPQVTLLRSGFVCCGHCGHSLHVHVMNDGYAYYCDDRHSPACSGGGIARQTPLLDGEAWAQVKAMLHDTARIRGLYDDMVEGSRERAEVAASTLRAIESASRSSRPITRTC